MKSNITGAPIPEAADVSGEVAAQFTGYAGPLLRLLDRRLDARLVRTFAGTVINIVRHRDRALSLLLTELGELLIDGAHAPAGVKRLERLLSSPKWTASVVGDWLLGQADRAVETAVGQDAVALLALDGSVVEKPTARKLEGLTKVRSAKAALLQRASGGPPPERPVVVPGFNWVAAVVTGLSGGLTLARLHWYSPTAPGEEAQKQREAEWSVLGPLLKRWGRKIVCLLDRGFDSHPFLGRIMEAGGRFIVRWRSDFNLVSSNGEEKRAGLLSRKVRSQWFLELKDKRHHERFTLAVASLPVTLPGSTVPLWLVVGRRKAKKAWWFLTTEYAGQEEPALWVVRAYARRWQVEWAFRYDKSELGMESVRIRLWRYREKMWAMAELVHAFLLHLLDLGEDLLARILRWCHRTGRRWARVIAPLYRLRHALASIWTAHAPTINWSQ